MFEHTTYDALVIGARCAGAATAMLMARSGLRVLAIDRGEYGADALSTHALMRAGVLQLHRWGALPKVVTAGTPSLRTATFHYGNNLVEVAIGSTHGVNALYAPRRTILDRLLVDAASEAGAEVRHGHALAGLLRSSAGACAARRFAIVKVASLRSRPVLSLVLTAWAQLSPDWSALWCAGRDVMQAPSRTATGPVCKCRGTTGTIRRA